MIINFIFTFISAFLAIIVSTGASIYLKKRDLNREILKERYTKAYAPFFNTFVLGAVSESFRLDYKDKMVILNKLNHFICENINYFEPKTQSDLCYLIKIGLYAEIDSESTMGINFYNNSNYLNLLKKFYNTLLYEYKDICTEMKLPVPFIEDFLLELDS